MKFRVHPADQPDSPGLLVEQIYSWDRGFMQHVDANSSGPKASIRNQIFELFILMICSACKRSSAASVFSRDEKIIVFLAGGEGVPAFKVQEIGQANTVTKPDFSVPVTGGLYGYC